MKRWMKILSAVVVVVVGLLVAGVAVLANMDFNQYKGLVAEQVKAATGRDLQIAGDLNLAISLTPAIEVNGVTFANAEWGSRPEMATVEYFAAEVALLPLLTQQIEISRLVLRNVDVLAETDASGRGNWEFQSAGEPAPAPEAETGGAATLPSVDRVAMENVSLTYRDGVTGETQRVRIESLTAEAPTLQEPVAFELVAQLNDETLEASGTLGSIDQMASPDTVYPVSVEASLLAAEIGFEGRLGTPGGVLTVNGTATVRGDSLVETMARAGTAVPALKGAQVPDAGAYEASVGVDMQGDTVKLTGLSATLGDSDLNGDVTLDLGGARPTVDAKLTSSLVDLTQLLPKTADEGGGAAAPADGGDGTGRVFPDDPLPLDGLKAANATLDYQAGKIIAPQDLTVTEVALAMTLKDGRLEVSKLEASSYKGKLAARALVDAAKSTPSVGLAAKLQGLDFGMLLKERGLSDVASGTLDADVEVAGNGASVRRIMAGLGGHTRFVVPGGKLDSEVLNIATGDIAAALPFLDSKDDKTIRCGVVDFRITDGIAAAKALVFETGGISAIGVGDANLKDETLNLAVDPRAKKQSLASMALTPVKIGGTFADPSIAPDPAALAGTVAGTAARAAGAVATMGLSLLAERAVGQVTEHGIDKTDYCTPALAGEQVVPGGTADQSSSSSSGGEPPAAQDGGGSGNPVEELGKGLQNLFGN